MHVCIGFPVHRDISPHTVHALLETKEECYEHGVKLDVDICFGGSLICTMRSKIVHNFLQGKADKLFWIDSDMVWRTKDFMRQLALSTFNPVIAGIYRKKQATPEFNVRNPGGWLNKYGCITVEGAGLGFSVVDREVLEKLSVKAKKANFDFPDLKVPIPDVFRQQTIGDKPWGEDMLFFTDVRELGYEVWADPNLSLGHVGTYIYTGKLMDEARECAA